MSAPARQLTGSFFAPAFQNLLSEVTQIVSARFQPNVTLIKKQIEVLVEKEYLERQEGQRDTYNYVCPISFVARLLEQELTSSARPLTARLKSVSQALSRPATSKPPARRPSQLSPSRPHPCISTRTRPAPRKPSLPPAQVPTPLSHQPPSTTPPILAA